MKYLWRVVFIVPVFIHIAAHISAVMVTGDIEKWDMSEEWKYLISEKCGLE
jgi:hypothetical protein